MVQRNRSSPETGLLTVMILKINAIVAFQISGKKIKLHYLTIIRGGGWGNDWEP